MESAFAPIALLNLESLANVTSARSGWIAASNFSLSKEISPLSSTISPISPRDSLRLRETELISIKSLFGSPVASMEEVRFIRE